jgi:CubicO group peptidase (beta-lactamase class C family)
MRPRRAITSATVAAALLLAMHCRPDAIRDRPISFSEWRAQQTLEYVNKRYAVRQQTLEMLPVMVVAHYTAIDSLDASYHYMNREEMESGRSQLKKAGGANIAVHFLVGKAGDIYRLMPENRIGRHVIGLNRHAIGIENVGLDENSLTMAQVEANALIVRRLAKKYPLRYLIGHSEYRRFENTPLWEELDPTYRTEKSDPGEWFMNALRERVADLSLAGEYNRSEIPDRIDYILRQAHTRGEFSGVALVIDNGQVIYRAAHGENPETAKPLKTQDNFYLASAAKPITALTIARLEAAGRLSYDTQVAQFFPELKSLLAGVKVSHLLSHTSGLDDYYRYGRPAPGFSNADALQLIATQKKLLARPGSRFHYANSNYLLLAELVQRLLKQPFAQVVGASVLSPAAMQNTAFVAEEANPKTVPALDSEGAIFRYGYRTVGPGGLASNVDDIAALDLAFMEDRLLTRRQRERLLRPVLRADKRPEFYAFGWYVLPRRQTVSHDGNFNGYHSMNWMLPKKRQAIILLSNRYTTKIREITTEIDRALNGLEALELR